MKRAPPDGQNKKKNNYQMTSGLSSGSWARDIIIRHGNGGPGFHIMAADGGRTG